MSFYVKDGLDRGNLNDLGDLARKAALGTMLSNLCTPITETAIAVNADVGTLAYLPSSVDAVYSTAGSTKRHDMIPAGVVPGAGEVAVDFAAGTLTFAAADAVTECTCVYHKCAEKANLVVAWPDVR